MPEAKAFYKVEEDPAGGALPQATPARSASINYLEKFSTFLVFPPTQSVADESSSARQDERKEYFGFRTKVSYQVYFPAKININNFQPRESARR